jgi:hypothetical protein|tara:strand:+ start:2175 stop:2819 length:645 start_codon:yes stop_codon:yes gene_type:complete
MTEKNIISISDKEIDNFLEVFLQIESALEESRVLTPMARRKLSRSMKVRKVRLNRRKKIVEKRPPSLERVKRLAARGALKFLKKKFASSRGEKYNELSISGKSAVDKIMQKKLANNKKLSVTIAKRMIPKIREKLLQRRKSKMQNESLNESFVAGIPDTVYAKDLEALQIQGGFAYHPSVLEKKEEDKIESESEHYEQGTDKLRKKYQKDTPGQ